MLKKIICLAIFLFSVVGIRAQESDLIFQGSNEVYFTFSVKSTTELTELSKIISIDRLTPGMQVFAYANKPGWEKFIARGISFEVLQHPGTLIRPRMLDNVNIREIEDWDFYPSYDTYVDMMYQYEENFPGLCDVFSIGTTNEGRELLVARITDNIGQQENEPEFFFTSSMHGDETTGYVLMLRLIDYLLNNYGENTRITSIVDGIDIYINPLANPDGSYHVGNSNIYGAQRFNAMGVDLNRNFPDPEDGPHPDGNAWQTETIHFMNFAEERNFVMGANFHGGAEVLNYPWDTWATLHADNDWWIYVCREFADTVHVNAVPGYLTGFNNGITNGYQWYTISGGRQDYMNYFHQCKEFTHEISQTKLLPGSQLPAHWDYNYRSFLNYIEQAGFGLRGRITDSATGDPLVAEVYVLGHETDSSWAYSSLPEGNYHRLLHEGTYTVQFKCPGYYTQIHEDIVINNRQATVLDIEMVNPFSAVGENAEADFKIYPNPAYANYLKIESSKAFSNISIFSLDGKMQQISHQDNFVDVSMLAPGIYIIRLEEDGRYSERKFVKK